MTQHSDAKNDTGTKPKRIGCLAKIIVGFALIALILYVIQTLIAPDVESDRTVDIQASEDSAGGESVAEQQDDSTGPKSLADSITMNQVESAAHPLDPLMTLADKSLEIIDTKFFDYSAEMLTQVRTGDTLHEENLMFVKVRHARSADDEDAKTPFSIYTRFLKPKTKVGQEAIWVSGQNDGMILGHATGLLNVKTVRLDPEGVFAMTGNRYPIYQIGFRNLIVKMKEFGDNDRKYGECDVKIERNVEVDGRPCTRLTITHPVKRDHFDYHIAMIYIDNEYEIPTGYEGYLWPEKEGDDPPLLEKYFYLDLQLNCNFEDIDFDKSNPKYDYPRW